MRIGSNFKSACGFPNLKILLLINKEKQYNEQQRERERDRPVQEFLVAMRTASRARRSDLNSYSSFMPFRFWNPFTPSSGDRHLPE